MSIHDIRCPGGCGQVFQRYDLYDDPPPIPWDIIDRIRYRWQQDGDWQGDDCPVCEIELEPAYQALLVLRGIGFEGTIIDPIAAVMNVCDWAADPDAPRTRFVASHLAHLDCGHRRPINLACQTALCPLCQTYRPVVWIEAVERQAFPHEDALSDLECV